MEKTLRIFLNAIPVLIMIGLIPFVKNDYFLTILYVGIITVSLAIIKYRKNDIIILLCGFVIMIISEFLFTSTGVETFVRNSLFGVMPLWLPFLWSYGFVAIGRTTEILNNHR